MKTILSKKLKDKVNYFMCGLSDEKNSIQLIPQAYEESIVALKYWINENPYERCHNYHDVKQNTKEKGEYEMSLDEKDIEKLKMYLHIGKIEYLESFIYNIKRKKVPFANLKEVFIFLVNHVFVFLKSEGIKPENLNISDRDLRLLNNIHNLYDKDLIEDLISKLFDKTCLYIRNTIRSFDFMLLKFVRENYTNQISLDMLEDKFGKCKSYLSVHFKKLTGQKYVDYVSNMRMERACELLMTDNETVETTARAVGYMGAQSFIKKFKRKFGVTPGQYRSMR